MEKYDAKDIPPFINIGQEKDVVVKELAMIIKNSAPRETMSTLQMMFFRSVPKLQ